MVASTSASWLTASYVKQERKNGSVEERFWRKVNRAGADECWEWTGFISPNGYGRTTTPTGSNALAHRISFVVHGGVLAQGLVIDHTCRNRRCVNPAHLRQVSQKTNALENSASWTAVNASKTHCKRGHELAGSNLCVTRGSRKCRICQQEHNRRYNRRVYIEQHPFARSQFSGAPDHGQ